MNARIKKGVFDSYQVTLSMSTSKAGLLISCFELLERDLRRNGHLMYSSEIVLTEIIGLRKTLVPATARAEAKEHDLYVKKHKL